MKETTKDRVVFTILGLCGALFLCWIGLMCWLCFVVGPAEGWLSDRFMYWEGVSIPLAFGPLIVARIVTFVAWR